MNASSVTLIRWSSVLPFLMAFSLAAAASSLGQIADFDLWQEIDDPQAAARLPAGLKTAPKRDIVPQRYRTLKLNRASMRSSLASAPREGGRTDLLDGVEIILPLPQGGYGRFRVVESPVMEASLAAKFPDIKSYLLQGIDDPTATGRLDTSPKGFRAMVIAVGGTFFIDPYWSIDDGASICYDKRDFRVEDNLKDWICEVEDHDIPTVRPRGGETSDARPTGSTRRIYRAAISATGEYTAFHGGTVAGALAAINTTLNRLNVVYERDFCLRMVLVGNNHLLVYSNAATDPYTDGDTVKMLDENQANTDFTIGSANYDIGHVLGGTRSSGRARRGSVGVTGLKARGVSINSSPSGDPFDIDFVAHEVGHQFNATHTFNAAGDQLQWIAATAFEPGSGSTIMAYAGIVAGQNLQRYSHDYFHSGSYTDIFTYVTVGGGRFPFSTNATGNSVPVIGNLLNRSIPARTPFALTAVATDGDNDVLTYCWEQYDAGSAPQNPVTADPRDNGSAPLFRSYPPTTNATRFFPSLPYVLDRVNLPPTTYLSNGLTYATGEALPTTSRTMNFRVSVRDNRAGGGGQNWASVQVTTISNTGPFRLSSHNSPATLTAGAPFPVTWDVAQTTASPINCASVRISLSTNGGTNFPIVLASSVPNNGSAMVTIPSGISASAARLKVEAADNIFFDINDADFRVAAGVPQTIFAENFGAPMGPNSIAAYAEGVPPATFQNSGFLRYGTSGQTSVAIIGTNSPSIGYSGASGGGHVFFPLALSGSRDFFIEGINASSFAGLSLAFAYEKQSASLLSPISVDYWNGSAWVTLANTASQLFYEAWDAPVGWYVAKTLNLPSEAQIADLKLRFVMGFGSIKIDDIKLHGLVPAGAAGYQAWLQFYRLDPAGAGAPGADPDADGYSNWAEFAFGGAPTVGDGALLRVQRTGLGMLVFHFLARLGFAYEVWQTADLAVPFAPAVGLAVGQADDQAGVPEGFVRRQFAAPMTARSFFRVQARPAASE